MAKLHISTICCALFATTLSLPSYGVSIEQAWQLTKQSDPSYEKAKIAVQLGEVGVDERRSSLLPSLSASANWNKSTSLQNTNGYNVQLNQTIWDSRLWRELDRAQVNYLKSKLELSQKLNSLAYQLLSAYLEVASAQGALQLAQRKWEEGAKLLTIIEKRYKAGKVKSIDVEEIKVSQVSGSASILRAKALLTVKRAELAALINQMPEQVDQVRTYPLVQPQMLVKSQEQWLKLAKNSSPELLTAIQSVRASELAKDSAVGGYYPKITGNLGYSDNDARSNGQFTAGLQLTVPIDLNGATRSKVDEASLNILSDKQEVRRVEIDIQKHIAQQFTQIDINWSQVLIVDELVESRSKVLRSKEVLYEAGMIEVSDVIHAHNLLFAAKHNLQSNLYNYWRQRIGLLKTAGKLDDDIIARISLAFGS